MYIYYPVAVLWYTFEWYYILSYQKKLTQIFFCMKKSILLSALAFLATVFFACCKNDEQQTAITDFKLDKNSIELQIDETSQLLAVFTPSDVTVEGQVSWSSSDDNIATVSDEGLVTAIALGDAVITASYGNFSDECKVSVVEVAVESIQLNKIELTLVKGDKETLIATVSPEEADNVQVTWSSSDEAVATVSSEGEVTAVYPGNAVISATAGNVTATCDVEVVPSEVESVTLSETSIEIYKDESYKLVAEILPEGTGSTIEWTTNNYYVASVADDGTVTGSYPGEAIITATAGDKSATCTVTVLPVDAKNIVLDPSEITLAQGEAAVITATVEPENYDGNIEWKSDNTGVVVVDVNGKITAVGDGSATVTATVGEVSATCKVTVSTGSSNLNIGDFYYSDGTWSQELDQSKTLVGIVFWTGNPTLTDPTLAADHPECTHGYVVALQENSVGMPWMENYDAYTSATQSGDITRWFTANAPEYESLLMGNENRDRLNIAQGYNNTKALEVFNEANPSYLTLAKYAVEYRETVPAPEGSSDWYVPSPKELSLLCTGNYDGDLMGLDLMFQTNIRDLVNSKLSTVSGATQISQTQQYWSSSVAGVPTAFTINMQFSWVSLANISNVLPVRCILAF